MTVMIYNFNTLRTVVADVVDEYTPREWTKYADMQNIKLILSEN
jgi:hypothetical protein